MLVGKNIRIAATAAALGALALAAPAQADLDLTHATSPITINGDSVQSVQRDCPNGYKVTGGGGFANGDYGEMKLQASYPVDGQDGNTKPDDAWKATGWNTASTPRFIEVQAICAKGVETKVVSKPFKPGSSVGKAKCPVGFEIMGGGIESAPSFVDDLELVESTPFGNQNIQGWYAFAFAPTTGATAWAVCTKDEDVKLRYPIGLVPVNAGAQGSGSGFCKKSEDVVGLGAFATTQQAAIVTIFGADSPMDGNNDLDDGTNLKLDNDGLDDVEAETHSICAK